MDREDWTASFVNPKALEIWMEREGYMYKRDDSLTIVPIGDEEAEDLHLYLVHTQLITVEDMVEKTQAEPKPEIARNQCPKCFENMVKIGKNPAGVTLWKCDGCGYLCEIKDER